MEYFPPELEENIFSLRAIGRHVEKIRPSRHYDAIADMAHVRGRRIGVADTANRPSFGAYYFSLLNMPDPFLSTQLVEPGKSERYYPTVTDGRRMITAEAIAQEAGRHPEGTRIAYIGAPAHVNRVMQYTQSLTWLDRARLAYYRHGFPGLEKALRIYEPNGDEWRLAERHDIVRRRIGKVEMATSSS